MHKIGLGEYEIIIIPFDLGAVGVNLLLNNTLCCTVNSVRRTPTLQILNMYYHKHVPIHILREMFSKCKIDMLSYSCIQEESKHATFKKVDYTIQCRSHKTAAALLKDIKEVSSKFYSYPVEYTGIFIDVVSAKLHLTPLIKSVLAKHKDNIEFVLNENNNKVYGWGR